MITVSVGEQAVADALGDLGEDARVILWDPRFDDIPADERTRLTLACLPHSTGGHKVFGRLAGCPALQVVQIASAGYEHALPFLPPGVALANARGVHDSRTAEMALALALAGQRMLPHYVDAQRRGEWDAVLDAPSLADRRALVVGYGSIGAAVAARLRACEVEVEGVGRTARIAPDGVRVHAAADLLGCLPGFDLVFITTPYDQSTDKLVDAAFLGAMRDGALLVNVARGGCVDTDALLRAVEQGRVRAALDVTDPEPLPEGHPLWSAPGVIITPHVGGWAQLTDRRYLDLVRRQVQALREGAEPVNLVARG